MNKIKFTGINIAAAILLLFYFFPWVSITALSLSGFSLTTTAVSPGLFSYFVSGLSRFYMLLAIIVPLSAAVILYQNITGDKKFSKYYKAAHILPALYFIVGIVGLYFKMKPDMQDAPEGYGDMYNEMAARASDMAPGVFDILTFAVYISVIAAVYLLLVNLGKIKDKEYYKPAPAAPVPGIPNEAPATTVTPTAVASAPPESNQ
jgi:hypothetical protein